MLLNFNKYFYYLYLYKISDTIDDVLGRDFNHHVRVRSSSTTFYLVFLRATIIRRSKLYYNVSLLIQLM